MNAAEFELFSDICRYNKCDWSHDGEPKFYCSSPYCTTLEGRCSRYYCPLLRSLNKKEGSNE